jgi:hypothetical protein
MIGGLIVWVWNSTATGSKNEFLANSLADRLKYLAWLLRDLNVCEFGNVLLLLVAPLLWLRRRNSWLIRLPLLLVLYVVAIVALYPLKHDVLSEVRYLSPTIPLWIALGVLVIEETCSSRRKEAVTGVEGGRAREVGSHLPSSISHLPLNGASLRRLLPYSAGVLVFGTNLLHFSWLLPFPYEAAGFMTPYPYAKTGLRSTPVLYARELLKPPSDPYTKAALWINQNLRPGQTLWIAPGYAVYPLMFHAPQVVYGWQLSYPPKPPYTDLAEIYFAGRQPPDAIVCFAGWIEVVRGTLREMEAAGIHYRQLAPLECFGREAHRPELFRRTFKPITGFNPQTEAIYLFLRKEGT